MNRRESLLTIGSMLVAAPTAASATTPHDPAPAWHPGADDHEVDVFRIWPGRAPYATGDGPDQTPTLTIYRPPKKWANGAAVVICPGGAYQWLATALEGGEPAAWMASRSVTAFVLKYRVGAAAPLPVPLLDGARAMRFVRAHASDFGVDPSKIGMMGFSAGGHLAAMTAAQYPLAAVNVHDEVESLSSRPDYLILAYPWLQATEILPDGNSSYCHVVKKWTTDACDPAKYTQYSPFAGITSQSSPTFIYHTSDDEVAPIQGSIRFFSELHKHGVPVEFHSFVSGQHGSGLGGCNPSLSQWPMLLQTWMRNDWLPPPPLG
ncbi:MAG: alpha/beta hydrolase fold domain-containing protein [Gallionella sp.]|jgi:acetyl esterase/lipase|nr:alpha/beta hydrolase fold domain-containing protein [Gallionella sp.]